jgi:hypothetical protein
LHSVHEQRATTFDEEIAMDELRHRYRRTPPLSLEGSREVFEEMANPPKDTPERRRMFERVRFMAALHKRMAEEVEELLPAGR